MRKVSLHERPVTNSLAYLLCQEARRATDYRPGMMPEDVRAVSEKSVRQHETTRAQVERQFWREAPRIRLTGVAEIEIGERGVEAERVAYDLNLASGILCRAFALR